MYDIITDDILETLCPIIESDDYDNYDEYDEYESEFIEKLFK